MIFAYEFDRLNTFLKMVLERNLSTQSWLWLENEGKSINGTGDVSRFNIAFVAMPRKTGKAPIQISSQEADELKNIRDNLVIDGWTCDRLSRVWLLTMVNPQSKEKYIATIENLFLSAEMSELVALYSALPVLAYAEAWRKRCAEGIRNNIGQVLEAVICNNPYASEQLDEAAWNQLVLKAIFTDKPVLDIVGLTRRRNKDLAESLSDYAHERWAARRDVNPLLWICVSPFMDQRIFADIQRLMASDDLLEKQAAALVCYETDFAPAKQLLAQHPKMKSDIEMERVSWAHIASRKVSEAL